MKPFSFGDEIKGDWQRYRLCPICGKGYICSCKCPDAEMHYSDGHVWHNEHGIVKAGRGLHHLFIPGE